MNLLPERKNMRRLVSALIAGTAVIWLATPRHSAAEEKKAKTELHKQMEQIDTGMKKLRRTLRKKESNPESLEWISKIEQAAIISKQMTPSRAATLPADQQPQFVVAYRKRMAQLVGEMLKMETALLDDDNAKAQDVFKELKTIEEDGHDKFMQDDEKDSPKPDEKK